MARVVFVESYPHAFAGQQQTLLSLLGRAARHGIEPIVLMPAEGIFAKRLEDFGVRTVVVPQPATLNRYGGVIYTDGLKSKLSVLRDTLRYVAELRGHLKSLRPDSVYCNDLRALLTAGIAAKTLGIPNLIWDKLDKPHGLLDSLQLPLATTNVVISDAVKTKYPRWQRWLYKNRIIKVSEGVDAERFARVASIREQLSLCDTNVVFAIVGTVTHRKGHDLLLRAFYEITQQSSEARLLVVGSWCDNESDRRYFDSLPHRNVPAVCFLGHRDDLPEIMNSIDVLVTPSRHEGLGMVILEAMSCGKPVIGAKTGGIAETVIDAETGILFPSEDIDGLTRAMSKLLHDKALRVKMGEAGRKWVIENYKREEKMDRICQLLCLV